MCVCLCVCAYVNARVYKRKRAQISRLPEVVILLRL